jgi:hypothetical protein
VSDLAAREAWRAFLRDPTPDTAFRWASLEARARGELADGEEWLDRTIEETGPALDRLSVGGPARVVRALALMGRLETPPTLRSLADTPPQQFEATGCGDMTLVGVAVLLEALGIYRDDWSLLLLRAERITPGVVKEVRRRASVNNLKALARQREKIAKARLAGASWIEAHAAAEAP